MIVLDVTPCTKPRMTRRDKWLKPPRDRVARYWDFCELIRIETRKHGCVLGDKVSLTFVLPMPKSWWKKKRRDMDGKPHQGRPDLSNLIKAFEDALFEEDSSIYEYGFMRKEWGEVGKIIVH